MSSFERHLKKMQKEFDHQDDARISKILDSHISEMEKLDHKVVELKNVLDFHRKILDGLKGQFSIKRPAFEDLKRRRLTIQRAKEEVEVIRELLDEL